MLQTLPVGTEGLHFSALVLANLCVLSVAITLVVKRQGFDNRYGGAGSVFRSILVAVTLFHNSGCQLGKMSSFS